MRKTTSSTKSRRQHNDDDPRSPSGLLILPVTETILGIDEATLVTLSKQERIKRFVIKEKGCFVNSKTKELVSFGVFETPTIQEMKEQVKQMLVPVAAVNNTTTNTTSSPPPRLSTRSGIDIGNLQGSLSTNDYAMVQVASNFNCLENPRRNTYMGRLVDKAYLDRTQGPAAVFGTTSAYLYRCHFLMQQHVNLLKNVSNYYGIPENGKLTLKGNEKLITTQQQIDVNAAQICIGLHQDCPIMFGRTSRRDVFYNEKKQHHLPHDNYTHGSDDGDRLLEFPLVDHVLSASINLHDFGVYTHLCDMTKTNLMRSLLRAAYEGVYLAAILRKRKVLYLTLVGGGNFGNPISLIVDEIQRAHDKWIGHPKSSLQEVIICLFSHQDEQQVLAALAATTTTNK